MEAIAEPVNVGRPAAIHRQIEDVLVDFELWERNARRDNVVTGDEALQALPILERMVNRTRPLVVTISHVTTCLTGQDGMFSPRARRGWNEAQARYPDNVVPFPSGGDAA